MSRLPGFRRMSAAIWWRARRCSGGHHRPAPGGQAGLRAGRGDPTLAAFVPHQANLRIVEAIARRLGAPQALVANDIVTAGNTSSASIPLALARMLERGEIPSARRSCCSASAPASATPAR